MGRPDQVCVMYLGHKGPPAAQRRFFGWVGRGAVLPFAEHEALFSTQKLKKSDRPGQFVEALEEARLWQPRGAGDTGPMSSSEGGEGGVGGGSACGSGAADAEDEGAAGESAQHCSKCGQALAGGTAFEFQGRQGLCRPCQRSFQSGCFCPVCDQAYPPTAKDMVCCDMCGCWIHARCDWEAQDVLRADIEGMQRGYQCPGCRGAAAAAPLAAATPASLPGGEGDGLQDPHVGNRTDSVAAIAQGAGAAPLPLPEEPHEDVAGLLPGVEGELDLLDFDIPADLEMVPAPLLRQGSGHDFGEPPGPSNGLSQEEKLRLRKARQERRVCKRRERREGRRRKKQVKRYAKSCFATDFLPGYIQSHKKASRAELQEIVLSHWKALDETLHRYYYKIAEDAVNTKSIPEWAAATARSSKSANVARKLSAKNVGKERAKKKTTGRQGQKRRQMDGAGAGPAPDRKKAAQAKIFVQGGSSLRDAIRDAKPPLPAEVSVICAQSYRGLFYVHDLKVLCMSDCCVGRPEEERTFTPVRWEAHCGAGSAKKWKSTIRLEPGTVPELPTGSVPKPIGRWLEQRGVVQGKPTIAVREATPEPEEDLPPWMGHRSRYFEPVRAVWAPDRCAVCDMDVDYDYDQFVSCDSCGITVHQSCYGVKEAPDIDDIWLCRACELREAGEPAPQCCLCPVEGGALKPTTIPGAWCHVTCMQWTPEVTVADVDRMEPIANIKSIQTERWELPCSICGQRMGAGIQCTECFTAYHPLCARMAGYFMEIREPEKKRPGAPLEYVSYCEKHRKPQVGETGLSLPGSGGTETVERRHTAVADLSAYILHARLPYYAPWNTQGCTRCVPLDAGWVRDTKGAGSGISSVKGFWIPHGPLPLKRPVTPPPLQPPPASLAARLGDRDVKGGSGDATDLDRPGLCLSEGVGRGSGVPEGRAHKPPTLEPLLPLPEGCPETLKIVCNGKKAVLNVRNQMVEYDGSEVTATRFEQLCGRPDSKKWKTSLCVDLPGVGNESEPETVGMWLENNALDHRLLSRLADNLSKRKAYELWEQETVALGVLATLDEALLHTFGISKSLQEAWESEAAAISAGGSSSQGAGAPVRDTAARASPTKSSAKDRGTVEREGGDPAVRKSDTAAARPGTNRCGHCATCRNPRAKKGCLTLKRLEKERQGGARAGMKSEPEQGTQVGIGVAGTVVAPGFKVLDVGQFGSECVGRSLCLYWDVDATWYRGRVAAYDEISGKHRVAYDDGEEEDVFLAAETWEYDKEHSQEPHTARVDRSRASDLVKVEPLDGAGAAGSPGDTILDPPNPATEVPAVFPTAPRERDWPGEPTGSECVGWRVGIWWVDDKCFYRAVVTGYEPDIGLHSVWYDDDVREDLLLEAESVQWLAPPGTFRPLHGDLVGTQGEEKSEPLQKAAEGPAEQAPAVTAPAKPAVLPEELPIVCNGVTATFLPSTQMVRLDDQSMVTPRQLEKLAGRLQAKKWKASIRVRKADGKPGRTLGDWFIEVGLDPPRAPKAPRDGGLGTSGSRPPKGVAFRGTSLRPKPTSGGGGGPLSGHRAGCLCVVCKNKRRLGLPAPGGGGGEDRQGPPSPSSPQTPRGKPTPQTGKRAFVEGIYHNPGLTRNHVSQIPLSRMWTGADWNTEQQKKFKQREEESAAVRARDAEVQALAAALKAEAVAQEVLKREAAAVAAAERKLAALAALEATADLVRRGAPRRELPPARAQPAVAPTAENAVGWRMGVWWADDACYYYGELTKFIGAGPVAEGGEAEEATAGERALYSLRYDDGLTEEVDLGQEQVDWVARADSDVGVLHRISSANGETVQPAPPPGTAAAAARLDQVSPLQRRCASAAPQGPDAEGWRIAVRWDEDRTYYYAVVEDFDEAEAPCAHRVLYDDGESEWLDLGCERLKWVAPRGYYKRPSGQVPAEVKVVCGTLEGVFQVHNRRVEVAGEAVTPMAFEKLGGRENAKKWKTSLRVMGADGRPGKNIGDWLIAMGVEMPRGKLTKAGPAPLQSTSDADRPPEEASNGAGTGKQQDIKTEAAAEENTPAQAANVAEPQPKVDVAPQDDLEAITAAPGLAAPQIPKARAPLEAAGAPPPVTAPSPSEPAKLEKRSVSMAEKLKACERTEGERILFGKSGIHGWGLFARRDIEQGEFLIEYRGDRIRPHVANERELQYRREGKDMYLFSLSNEWIVDATDCGSAARFVNHSCAPSTMSKIVDVDGFPHLVFVARCAVQAGQELTYDYRLAKEDDGEKLPCLCGAPTCRGTLN